MDRANATSLDCTACTCEACCNERVVEHAEYGSGVAFTPATFYNFDDDWLPGALRTNLEACRSTDRVTCVNANEEAVVVPVVLM